MTQAEIHHEPLLTGGKTGQYLEVETALSFSSPVQELDALRSGCAVFELNWRALIAVTGKDRVRWLHNMVTNNVRDLPLNRGAYNFVLNAQGRILADLYVINRGESLLLETDRAQVETLLATLRRFIIMDKVELTDLANQFTAVGIGGPKAAEKLRSAGIEVSGLHPLEIQEHTIAGAAVQVIRGADQKSDWFELWTDAAHAGSLAASLTGAGAHPVGAEALETWRVLRGIPQYGKDIRDRDLPQETGQVHALNFNKGCYIGQEIVERIRSRGQVHRKFTGFEFSEGASVPGRFEAGGRAFAEVTSVVRMPSMAGEREVGLGYVRVDAVPDNRMLDLNGVKAKLVDLPFPETLDK